MKRSFFKTVVAGVAVAVSALSGVGRLLAQTTAPASDLTVQSVKVQGSLDLENGVPIRWKKPDGSGYVNIFVLDKNGTLQLCHDPFYFEQPKPDKSVKVKSQEEK